MSKKRKQFYLRGIHSTLSMLIFSGICGFFGGICFWGITYLPWNNWNFDSMLANWVGAIGSILAIVTGFYQARKQLKLKRAEDIERARPRFACNFLNKTKARNTIILCPGNIPTYSINRILSSNTEYRKILIKNISLNAIYEIAIKLVYEESRSETGFKEEIYTYAGIKPYENIVVIPKNDEEKINSIFKKLLIRFSTSANEEGFCIYEREFDENDQIRFINPQYYYVISDNTVVKATGEDKMIPREEIKDLDLNFDKFKMYKNAIVNHK